MDKTHLWLQFDHPKQEYGDGKLGGTAALSEALCVVGLTVRPRQSRREEVEVMRTFQKFRCVHQVLGVIYDEQNEASRTGNRPSTAFNNVLV